MLLRFLNADLSNYEMANKTFFYAYGFEILKDLDKNYKFELSYNYENNENYLKAITKIFEDLQEELIDLQQELIKAVTYIYNLNNESKLEKYSYSRKYDEFNDNSEFELLETLHAKNMVLSMSDTHKSTDLSSICYAILDELSKTSNYPIKKCQHCGMYFIPTSKVDEIYCDYPKENSKTCRELGAFQTYTEKLKQNKAMGEYRRTYQQKFMQVRKDKDNQQLAQNFETWKTQAKEKINQMKKGELTEDEVYNWLVENK